jgi:hypothetical protein
MAGPAWNNHDVELTACFKQHAWDNTQSARTSNGSVSVNQQMATGIGQPRQNFPGAGQIKLGQPVKQDKADLTRARVQRHRILLSRLNGVMLVREPTRENTVGRNLTISTALP